MKRGLVAGAALSGTLLAIAAIVGIDAVAQVRPLDMINYRKAIMQANSNYMDAMSEYAKGNVTLTKPETIAAFANALVGNSKEIPTVFPEGTGTGRTNALPEIWTKRADFDAAAKNFGTEATKLVGLAKAGNDAAIKDQIGVLSRACGACHMPFRKRLPPK